MIFSSLRYNLFHFLLHTEMKNLYENLHVPPAYLIDMILYYVAQIQNILNPCISLMDVNGTDLMKPHTHTHTHTHIEHSTSGGT